MPGSEYDSECPVCLQHYTRQKRVPRRLHCKHTFCTPCLECLASHDSCNLCTVRCPLCRWTTCVGLPGQGPQDSLWVNSELWDCIPSTDEEEDEITVEDIPTRSTTSTPQPQRNVRPILNIPSVMSKLGFKRPQRSVVARPLPWIRPVCRYFSHRSKAATRQGRTVF
nr:RING finger protein 223-like [Paramormyrops kingsleyae]